ncbi:Two-component response regulator ARR9 [Striga hermonthica]|uniref:Two-component response regulator ARR9 n=1 Tax=Striga hermonthica TaxID=68872 RepID=A0A9N7R0P2_STRHE|nr:Two-component response regulator ARR9 [Striga hermonthica]
MLTRTTTVAPCPDATWALGVARLGFFRTMCGTRVTTSPVLPGRIHPAPPGLLRKLCFLDCSSIIDRKWIERLLKTSSYQVTVVDSGVKALEFLGLLDNGDTDLKSVSQSKSNDHIVDLIITDYSMPALTGYDLLRKIKESEMLKDIPVVIMSSENIPSRINTCLEQGAQEFFVKPVRQSDVNKLRPHLMRCQKEFVMPQLRVH